MTQTRVWDFKEIDSTAILNAMILATLRNRNIGSTATTQIRPGRLAVPSKPASPFLVASLTVTENFIDQFLS